MTQEISTIAVVLGESSTAAQGLLRDVVERWRPSARIAGVVEEGHGLEHAACSAGRLRSLVDGSDYPIFQDLGPGSAACHLDGRGAVTAAEAVRRDIAAGCDLVVLSKFGKLESQGEGLAPAFIAAFESGVPLLTSVSLSFREAWERFAAQLFVTLPARPEAIDAWWAALSATRVTAPGARRVT